MITDSFSNIKSLFVDLTYRCNLHCQMCYYHGPSSNLTHRMRRAKEISLALLGDLLDQLVICSSLNTVVLTGAEPLIRKDTVKVIELIKSHYLKCVLLTNGTLIDETLARAIVHSGLDEIKISLDGSKNIHNLIRGDQKAFYRVMLAIDLLNEFKRTLDSNFPLITLGCVISAANLGRLTDLVQIAARKNVPLDLLHLMWLDQESIDSQIRIMHDRFDTQDTTAQGFRNTLHQLDCQCLIDDLQASLNLANRLGVELSISKFSEADLIRQWYSTSTSALIPGYCPFVRTAIRLNVYGEVVPCEFVQYVYGDIRHSKFEDIWVGERRQIFMNYLQKVGMLPICQRCCKLIIL